MKISIEELENASGNQIIQDFHEILSEFNRDKPVVGVITARLIPGGLQIEGHVEVDMIFECDRCLDKYSYHADVDINEIFIRGNLSSAKEFELTQDNFVEELKDRNEIDVTDLVYQSIILNIPGKKICKEECSGNENFQKLESEQLIDPRLEIFKKLSNSELNE